MSWEYTDINMAPRSGRAAELRGEASRERPYRELLKQKRSQRSLSLRSRVSHGLAALGNMISPHEPSSPRVTPAP
jgi:hypothetical protein